MEHISPEVLELAKKMQEKKAEQAQKRSKELKVKYPWIKEDSLRYEADLKRYSVEIDCVKCGQTHRRHTSDLFQTNGLCPSCKGEAKKEAKKEKAELVKKAMKAIEAGEIE